MKAPCMRYLQVHDEKASRQKSPMSERETGNARNGKSRKKEERRRERDGDSRARKHLQRIGLARVFNLARGFLVGETKRGQVKRNAKKIARARHFSVRV